MTREEERAVLQIIENWGPQLKQTELNRSDPVQLWVELQVALGVHVPAGWVALSVDDEEE
jgi:hypothetical protein